jgi:hypothetical protein
MILFGKPVSTPRIKFGGKLFRILIARRRSNVPDSSAAVFPFATGCDYYGLGHSGALR